MTRGDIERAWVMREEGRSIRAIAVAMKVPRATLARALAEAPRALRPCTALDASRS